MAENGGGAVSLLGGAGFRSNTMWPGPRPTAVPIGILMHRAVWPQYTNVANIGVLWPNGFYVTDRTYRHTYTGQLSDGIGRTV